MKKAAKKSVKKKTTKGKKTPNRAPKTAKKAKKAPVRKVAAKNATKKAAKKTAAKKSAVKPVAKKTKVSKKAASKAIKKPAKKADTTVSQSTPVKKKSPASTIKSPAKKREAQNAAETMTASAPVRRALSNSGRAKAARGSAFTLEDVREITKRNQKRASKGPEKTPPTELTSNKPTLDLDEIEVENRVLGAASLADVLGYDPGSKTPQEDEEKKVPKKYLRYYRLLVELRDHVNSELSLHTEDTLKRSSKEDSGDLSSYSQHIADAGTDTFDRDFALSLVSSEQEALHEVEEAINRIKTGTYGICELTGKPISKERLLAVPFARYSVESQAQVEKTTRRNVQRGGIFADATAEDGARFIQDDSDS
jgi:RNA polymerase-binding transcription factor DksA